MNRRAPPTSTGAGSPPENAHAALEAHGVDPQRLDRRGLGLPDLDVSPRRAELIRRRAHAILRAEQAAPPVGSFAWRYQHSIEPALLIGLALCQALWAVHGTWSLLR